MTPDGPPPPPGSPGTLGVPVVRLGSGDAGELLTLQRAAYVTEAQLHDDLRIPPLTQTLTALAGELSDPAVVALGIRDGARLVASVRLRDLGGGEVALGRLAVAPDRQGQGLGTALLRAADAAIPGTRRITLFTGALSAANLRLYRREGYSETHRTPAGQHELVHLAKDCTAGAAGLTGIPGLHGFA